MFIDTMCFLGLAWGRKRATGAWAKLKQRRMADDLRDALKGEPLKRKA